MGQPIPFRWATAVCAALMIAASAVAAPPTSQPARKTRLDLLYLHARLLTCDADLPDPAKPILDEAAKQKTWTTSRTPVALLNPEQARALVAAFAGDPGVSTTAGSPTMLVPNRRVTTTPRPATTSAASTTKPSDRPRFELITLAGAVDDEGAVPLSLSVTAVVAPRRWSADLAVAAPVEQTLLLDLGAPTPPAALGKPSPRAFLLVRPSAQPVDRKDDAVAFQVAGDLYRSWDRVWPLVTQLSVAIQNKQFADARRQAAVIREQLRPTLDAAEGTDYDRAAAAIAEHLDVTATALRRFDLPKASQAFGQFRDAGNALHTRLSRLMANAGRLPPNPATRPDPR